MSKESPVYVDKRHYDTLLRAYGCLKRENADLKKSWETLKENTENYGDQLLLKINEFDQPLSEMYEMIGKYNVTLLIRHDIKKLEENRYVSPDHK